MNIVGSITSKCRDLVKASSIAVEDKRVIEKILDKIEKLVRECTAKVTPTACRPNVPLPRMVEVLA